VCQTRGTPSPADHCFTATRTTGCCSTWSRATSRATASTAPSELPTTSAAGCKPRPSAPHGPAVPPDRGDRSCRRGDGGRLGEDRGEPLHRCRLASRCEDAYRNANPTTRRILHQAGFERWQVDTDRFTSTHLAEPSPGLTTSDRSTNYLTSRSSSDLVPAPAGPGWSDTPQDDISPSGTRSSHLARSLPCPGFYLLRCR
jgi:hypothetical protein